MKKSDIIKKIEEIKSPKLIINAFLILIFALLFTSILVSKYFFQTIVDIDDRSKVQVIAPKDIEVNDDIATDKRKKEASNRVPFVYAPADDTYIKNNLNEIIQNITLIREKNADEKSKKKELETLLDIPDNTLKQFVFSFLLNVSDKDITKVFEKAENTLNLVLNEGITEKDFNDNINNIPKIIRKNIEAGTSNNHSKVIVALLEQVIVPNMLVDEKATELAKKIEKEKVKPVTVKFKKGDIIVKAGEPITKVKREALSSAGYNFLRINYTGIIGIFCLVCIGIFSVIFYLKYFETQFLNRRHLSIAAFLSIIIALISVLLPLEKWSDFILPLPFFAIMLSVFLNPRTSFFITIMLLTLITFSLQFSALKMSVFIIPIMIAIIGMNEVRYSRRFDLIKVGLYTSVSMAVIILCVYFDLGFDKLGQDIAAGIFNGFISGIFALGIIPVIENVFKVVTTFGLAELGDYNQPLLKSLHETAPGTFEHSLRVSNLAETAAEAIGADPVLARVGALYHDVGKIVRPLFFVENQTYSGIENPHEKLTPRSSKMVITAHTKDGVALAKKYHIPQVIQEFIARHHGDSLASYFYNQALAQEGSDNVNEEQFRYTGPKPNTKEIAILMIADAVESASRTLKDHSQEELEILINKIIKDRMEDNQLDESPLTLKDIKIIAATLSRVLRSVFHKRIKYNEAIEDLRNKEKFNNEQNTQN